MEYEEPSGNNVIKERVSRRTIGMVIIVVLLLIIGAVVATLWYTPSFSINVRTAWSALTLSGELETAQFLTESEQGTVFYTKSGRGFTNAPTEGVLVSHTESAAGSASIIRTLDGKEYRIVVNGKTVLSSPAHKAHIALAPNGKNVAFSETVIADISAPAEMLSIITLYPAEWSVRVMDVETGTMVTAGTGITPVFVDDQHVTRVAPRGVYSFDLATGRSTALLEKAFPVASLNMLVSPDRTKMAIYNRNENSVIVYKISSIGAEEVITLNPGNKVMSLTLGNDGLYTLRTSKWGTEFLQQNLVDGNQKVVDTIPEDLRINRLLISSI